MTAKNAFCALAGWAPRDQPPDDLAARWLQAVRRIQPLYPGFARWYWGDERETLLPLHIGAVADAVAAGVGRDDNGREEPKYGYRLYTATTPAWPDGSRDFRLNMHGDMHRKHAHNYVSLTTAYCVDPEPEVVAYDIFKNALLALAESFAATHAMTFSNELGRLWGSGWNAVDLPIAWISYLGPAYAPLVTPPPTAIVEHRPDGGLLMAATDETFSVDNPAHMAVARDIAAAVAPFNALPRPLGGGRYDERCLPIRD